MRNLRLIMGFIVLLFAFFVLSGCRNKNAEMENAIERHYKNVFNQANAVYTFKQFKKHKVTEEKDGIFLVRGYWIVDQFTQVSSEKDGILFIRVKLKQVNPSGMLVVSATEFYGSKGFDKDSFMTKAFWENEPEDFSRIVWGDSPK